MELAIYNDLRLAEDALLTLRDASRYNQKMEVYSLLDGSYGLCKYNELHQGYEWTKMLKSDVEKMLKTGDWK